MIIDIMLVCADIASREDGERDIAADERRRLGSHLSVVGDDG